MEYTGCAKSLSAVFYVYSLINAYFPINNYNIYFLNTLYFNIKNSLPLNCIINEKMKKNKNEETKINFYASMQIFQNLQKLFSKLN